MTWEAILGLGVWSAVVSGGVAWFTAKKRIEFDREKLGREFQLEYATEEAIRFLLKRPEWEKRSFGEIKKRPGGFADDELRRHLVRAGAIRFSKGGIVGDDNELWGLRERRNGGEFAGE